MRHLKQFIFPFISLLLLLGLIVYQQGIEASAAENNPYHEAVATAINDLPMSYDDWVGRNTDVPKAAAELLHANEVRAFSFRHITSGESFDLVIVHCANARDLLGHYPPVCYPAQGWLQRSLAERELTESASPSEKQEAGVADDRWTCNEYRFERMDAGYSRQMSVINYMVLPDGTVEPSMDAVNRAAADLSERSFGALQVQVVFSDPAITAERRIEIAESFMAYLRPVLRAVWNRE